MKIQPFKWPMEVILGNGHALEATGRGTVSLRMKLSDCSARRCKLAT